MNDRIKTRILTIKNKNKTYWHSIDCADSSAPVQQEAQGGFKEDVGLEGGAAGVVVEGGNGVGRVAEEEGCLFLQLPLIQLQPHLGGRRGEEWRLSGSEERMGEKKE